jgi:hypothetical protein
VSGRTLASGRRLRARLTTPRALDPGTRASLHALLAESVCGTTRAGFERDLDEKDWVLLLEEREDGALAGFSTQQRLTVRVDGERVAALFSGDTIVRRPYWGEPTLARAWARLAFDVAAAEQPARTFWFLVCSGYRSYRFLPVFFQSFHPRRGLPAPLDVRRILEAFARSKYAHEYDPASGVVRLRAPSPLRPGIAGVIGERLRDPDVAFFARANPGHARGDELACLAEISAENLTPAGRRMLRSCA